MKKIALSFLIMSISGCFDGGGVESSETISLNEFDLNKNLIRINGKSIASEIKVIDTGLLIDSTKDNMLWIQGELLVAEIQDQTVKNAISNGSLKSFNVNTKISKELIPYKVESVCLEDGIIKIKGVKNEKDENGNGKLNKYLQENNVSLEDVKIEEYKNNAHNIEPIELNKNKVILNTNTGGCEEKYVLNKNEKITKEETELVSYVESVYPFTSVNVYHDNSPKQKEPGTSRFKEKDFPRTRIHYKYTDDKAIVQEKIYKMNLNIDYQIKVRDFDNFNKIEGEIRGNSITSAFHVIDQIYIINFTKIKDGLKPISIEKIDISEERKRLFLNAKIKKINKVRNGYILTIEKEGGIELMIQYKKELGLFYLIKGINISSDIKVSENLCNVAIGHKFTNQESRIVKILNVCDETSD